MIHASYTGRDRRFLLASASTDRENLARPSPEEQMPMRRNVSENMCGNTSGKMTRERAAEFGAAWNSRDADLVASFFTSDGAYHASVGPDALGKSHVGRENIRRGVQAFFDRFPDGKFENLKVVVAGDIGTFEWDFVATDANGKVIRTAGCDLLEFVGDKVSKKNAFRKQRG
jgi:uncharacterized protein (TIGR02246 family)